MKYRYSGMCVECGRDYWMHCPKCGHGCYIIGGMDRNSYCKCTECGEEYKHMPTKEEQTMERRKKSGVVMKEFKNLSLTTNYELLKDENGSWELENPKEKGASVRVVNKSSDATIYGYATLVCAGYMPEYPCSSRLEIKPNEVSYPMYFELSYYRDAPLAFRFYLKADKPTTKVDVTVQWKEASG